jgi:hypothetical protein
MMTFAGADSPKFSHHMSPSGVITMFVKTVFFEPHHGEVRLAAGAGKCRRQIEFLAGRGGETEDEHVFRHPAPRVPKHEAMRRARHFLPSNALPP